MKTIMTLIMMIATMFCFAQNDELQQYHSQKHNAFGMIVSGACISSIATIGSENDVDDKLFRVGNVYGSALIVAGIVSLIDSRKHYRRANAHIYRQLKQNRKSFRCEQRLLRKSRLK